MRSVVGRLHGWGGVGAMGAACVLTAALTLVPLSHRNAGQAQGGAGAPDRAVQADARTAEAPKTAPDADTPPVCPTTGQPPEASRFHPSPAAGPTIKAMQQRVDKKLIVGVDQNSYDWGYLDPKSGQFEGFDIDLAHAIAKNIFGSPDDIIFKPVATAQRIDALNSGKVDIVVRTMTIDCDRIRQADFSTAYFAAGQQVLAPKSSDITGYNDSLRGKRVCTATGSTAVQALESDHNPYGAVYWDSGQHKGNNPGHVDVDDLSVPNQLDCLVRLQLGLVDAVITDNALAEGQAAQDPAVELKGKPFTTEYYGVAAKYHAPGKSDDLMSRINYVLDQYRAGGTNSQWEASYNRWIKADPQHTAAPPSPRYTTG
jgi:polar amino acid transport system substrate-binding protein